MTQKNPTKNRNGKEGEKSMGRRIIKFRARREDTGEWVYGHPFTKLAGEFEEFHHLHACDATGYWGIVKIIPETLSEYTGEGEYYEGDVLEFRLKSGLVTYGMIARQGGRFDLLLPDGGMVLLDALELVGAKDIKVIGHQTEVEGWK